MVPPRPPPSQLDRIESAAAALAKEVSGLTTQVQVLATRVGFVETRMTEREEARRHWSRYAVATLCAVALVFLTAWVSAKIATGS